MSNKSLITVGSEWLFISSLKNGDRQKIIYPVLSITDKDVIVKTRDSTHRESLSSFLSRFYPVKNKNESLLILTSISMSLINHMGLTDEMKNVLIEMEI